MSFDEFLATLDAPAPPAKLSAPLHALWLDRKGDWNAAHELASGIETRTGAHLHAYLHRKEGDRANARYWYGQAGVAPATGSLEDEWERLARELVRRS